MKHGYAFADHIKTEKFKRRRYAEDKQVSMHDRWYLIPSAIIIVGCILLFHLFSVQIIQGNYYAGLSDSNRIRTQIIHAPRGVIFDRNGVPLVYNSPGFRQTIACPDIDDKPCKTEPLSKEQALQLLAKGAHDVEVDSLREYRYKDALSHVLGYIGQISQEELSSSKYEAYKGNDWIGKSGIERAYEKQLRGVDGRELVEVDAAGQKVRSLGQTDPLAGQDMTLTVDLTLQQAAYEAARDVKKGAVIVSKPNGEILAMVSKPSFDPNLFTLDETYKSSTDSGYTKLEEILTDGKTQPLMNRAVEGVYPPGSTFKIITSAAGLENNVIDRNFRLTDTGVIKVGEFSFANWYFTQYGQKEPGQLDVKRALARSNDIFYYKLAEMVTVEKLAAMAKTFGVGEESGIDLGGEVTGILPTKQWKKKYLEENWYLGDTYHYGIGQGYLLSTPLQVHSWAEVIANGGTLYQPRLNKDQESKIKAQKFLSDETVGLIRDGMVASCSEGGVAYPLYNFKVPAFTETDGKPTPKFQIDEKNFVKDASGSASMVRIPIACKTGTAQHGGEETPPHAWITAFAPAYKPEIVVTVLVDSGGEGSKTAAPIAKKVFDAYFR